MTISDPTIPTELLELSDLLRPALHRVFRQLRRENMELDAIVTPLQSLLMLAIVEHPGIGVAELARLEKLRGPTISGYIKALEASGLVARSAPHPEDRRRVGLLVTDKGLALMDEMRIRRREWMARKLAALSIEDRTALRNAISPLNEIGK